MRLFLLTRTGPAEDIIWNDEQLIGTKKFINKIYQAGRFLSINAEKYGLMKEDFIITNYYENIINNYCNLMDNHNFLEANRMIQSHFKQLFCDQWIESNKKLIWEGNKDIIREGINRYKEFLLMLEPTCPMISYFLLNHFFK